MAAAPDEGPHVEAGYPAERIFVIGLDNLPAGLVRPNAALRQFPLSALTSALLYLLKPDRVICPLVGDQFDAVQVIEKLAAIGFGGRVTVVGTVPNPRMVLTELAAINPVIEVELVSPPLPEA